MTPKTLISPSVKWMILSLSTMTFGAGFVFPFYLIFIKEMSGNFTEFGIAFGLFTLFFTYLNRLFNSSSERYGRKAFLLAGTWGTAFLFLLFPIVSSVWQIYVLQIALGTFGAMQKTSKAFIADMTEGNQRGELIGRYHFGGSLFSGAAVIVGGVLIDFFTLDLIFYLGSFVVFFSGLMLIPVKESRVTS